MRMVKFFSATDREGDWPVWINADLVQAVIPSWANKKGQVTSRVFMGPGEDDRWAVVGSPEDVVRQLEGGSHAR